MTLEHLKRLEGEVLNAFADFGLSQRGVSDATALDLAGERAITAEAQTVDPHNLLGIEINPRAAAIAEVVLWIGYLQWHFRTRGDVNPPTPVIRDFRNIECRDAVLAYDRVELVTDERGVPVTRWDGKTMKPSPVTGEPIPDDAAQVPIERYVNARKAAWPEAEFVVGNPPFIGNKRMRAALGDGYVEALRGAWTDVPDSVDFVMYWWHHAAQLTRRGALQRFGLITTNSITQSFNRRVVEAALLPGRHAADVVSPASDEAAAAASLPSPHGGGAGGEGRVLPTPQDKTRPSSGPAGHLLPAGEGKERALSLVFAIPDHPWVDSTDGAAVRIAMTVADQDKRQGRLSRLMREDQASDGEITVELSESIGDIHADLRTGAHVGIMRRLESNKGIACPGVQLSGQGFIVSGHELSNFSAKTRERLIRRYITGRDVAQVMREQYVLDTFGLDLRTLELEFPDAFQWLLSKVKPERDHNPREKYRREWWLHAEPRGRFRAAFRGIARYVITSRTARYRTFQFIDASFLPETKVLVMALDDSFFLNVLSSSLHIVFANKTGGWLGAGNDSTYNHSECLEKFPFPQVNVEVAAALRTLGDRLDTHRKRQQSAHPDLTLTGMYNVLEKLRSGEVLSAKERIIHEHGLVSVLRQIHDELDTAVLAAYGWSDLLPTLRIAHGNDAAPAGQSRDEAKRAFDEAVLERLVALNAERAAEEARGLVRWLRPESQAPDQQRAPEQGRLDTEDNDAPIDIDVAPAPAAKPRPWPKDAVEQVRSVADLLAASPGSLTLDEIASRFTARGPWKRRLPQLLDMLVALGRASEQDTRYTAAGR